MKLCFFLEGGSSAHEFISVGDIADASCRSDVILSVLISNVLPLSCVAVAGVGREEEGARRGERGRKIGSG